MHLVYFDESGNSGLNLNDPEQPLFVLCALIVPEAQWLSVERTLEKTIEEHFPRPRAENFEIHGSELRRGRGAFAHCTVAKRLDFRNALLRIVIQHSLKIVFRRIVKRQYAAWLKKHFGSGVGINPHLAAFPLVARVVDEYLKNLPGSPLGMFVFDENKEVVADVEDSIRLLRGIEGSLKLGQIIEKGFFIDSRKSLVLQLCDICTFTIRKHEEAKERNQPGHPLDVEGYALLEPFVYKGNEAFSDVMAWLTGQAGKKNSGQGLSPESVIHRPTSGR